MNIYQPQKQIAQKLLKYSKTTIIPLHCFNFSSQPQESNVLKGQHIRYIPKNRLKFKYISPEGPLTLIFQGSENLFKRAQNWKLSVGIAFPGAVFAYYTFGMAYWWAYPMLFLPTAVSLYDTMKLKYFLFRTDVYKMWLYQNGDQVLVQTYDKMLHKLNIINNSEHQIVSQKDSLIFVMSNSGREFAIANKQSALIDFDLVDRIIKGIRVDTFKFQKLYNRLLFRQTPLNLRPSVYNRYVPQVFNINSNKTIWKILNRTIYREEDPNWLRKQESLQELKSKNLPHSERETLRKLSVDYGLKPIYPEELFYKTHKISRKDFLQQLENAKSQQEKEQLLMKLYEDQAIQGRRGVLEKDEAIKIIQSKIKEKQRLEKAFEKYKKENPQDPKIQFASFKDLV